MKRNHFIGLIIYVLVMVLGGAVLLLHDGIDDEGVPNIPLINERANACYSGASLSGRCETDEDWQCGWAWIRLENNLITRDTFPEECATLLTDTNS
jgi:hypothetical protein